MPKNSPQGQGAWIFVSHSHRDLEKVREIRNELERRGCNPLLFFLKCLDADNGAGGKPPRGAALQQWDCFEYSDDSKVGNQLWRDY